MTADDLVLRRRIAQLTADLATSRRESDELRTDNDRLRQLLGLDHDKPSDLHREAWNPTLLPTDGALPAVDADSLPEAKVHLYRTLFVGRDDVYATRWESASTGKSGWSPVVRGGWGGARRANPDYLPLTDEVVIAHLAGKTSAGLYPLRPGDVCQLLVCDFDGRGWTLDALAQDFLPKAGFGNLIALPLQGDCRKRGATEFLDPATLKPWHDQWAFLSSVARLTPEAATSIVDSLRPVEVGPAASKLRRPRRTDEPAPPEVIPAFLGSGISIARIGLPPSLLASLKHLASLHNPEYYEKERLRFSTFRTPRFVRCYWEDLEHLHLPRGLLPQVERIVAEAGSRLAITDARSNPKPIELEFRGSLSAQQEAAVAELEAHDLGVLVAPPGEGKTVMACALIARHGVPTLVLVDRKPLAEQWQARLQEHLGLGARQIGQVGGGRNRLSGMVDIATIQTLARREEETNADLFAQYGLVVVDECHHVPAVTFDRCLRTASTRRWIGLTATPYRRHGLEEIIEMHCGPVRHTITVAGSTSTALLRRDLIIHETASDVPDSEAAHIQALLAAVADDRSRTASICDDVAEAVGRNRNC
ncbi:MAG: DEAD/DEAH box helicase family protein, partial [Actinobacteria bacterium]|nr:DEAD/DEAH box helicase family protein [Actinomycetota bacterium]